MFSSGILETLAKLVLEIILNIISFFFFFSVGAILGTTKPQETIVREVETYDSKWKIDQGTQLDKSWCNNDMENASTVVCGNY